MKIIIYAITVLAHFLSNINIIYTQVNLGEAVVLNFKGLLENRYPLNTIQRIQVILRTLISKPLE